MTRIRVVSTLTAISLVIISMPAMMKPLASVAFAACPVMNYTFRSRRISRA